ncbi:helix-turn-helix transcriptional regulator [Desulfobacter sp.]|uniref:helix-turn-helix transcriptional regulator n=1 Tax=Desulfobacter sp. TaxID=2294 RepID=UPI003D11D82F
MSAEVTIKNPEGRFIRFPGEQAVPGPGRERVRSVPAGLGQGQFLNLDCRSGMDICMSCCRFTRDYLARIAWPAPRLTFVFCLSGTTRTLNACRPSPFGITAGQAHLHYFEDPHLERRTAREMEIRAVVIRFPSEKISSLLGPPHEPGPQKTLAKAIGQGHLFYSQTMNFTVQSVLHQMYACPHQGLVRQIFLESKAMELVAYTLEQAFDTALPGPPIRTDERDRIGAARDILVSRLKFPPSLTDLARQAGMSHTRLTRGFKKVFGCTVFEYLRKERLAYARMLLSENRLSITDAAFEAGFCSSSHFAQAFRKQFGISPSEFTSRK